MFIFLSTPISDCVCHNSIHNYKGAISLLVERMRKSHMVWSEIERIASQNDYETPENSIQKDLHAIQSCDLFVLHYPHKVPTSALIELGFAIANNKRIIVITPKISTLPFLAQGINALRSDSIIIDSERLDNDTIDRIMSVLEFREA